MYKTRILLLIPILLFCFLPEGRSQIGGTNTYNFLNLQHTARSAAMGSHFLTVIDNDVSLGINNPSLINPEMFGTVNLNFVDYYTDVNFGSMSYAMGMGKIGNLLGSVQYINYGKFELIEETGERGETFQAADYAVSLGWGKQLDSSFSVGVNLKGIFSSYERYNSFGLATDLAAAYQLKNGMVISAVARNLGRQLKTYTPGNQESLPLEVMAGISQRFAHLPFRYSVLFTNLQKWDLTYVDPAVKTIDEFTGEPIVKQKSSVFADNLMRHIIIGGEITPVKYLSLRFGYNYKRRMEMQLANHRSLTGFSWGFGVNTNRFTINYARSAYHVAGSPNYFSINFRLGTL